MGIVPNMLAPLFGRTPELRSIYPQDVWPFLNTPPASDPRIRIPWRKELINEWVQEKRIGPPDAPGSQHKIDLLTSRIAEHKRLPIDVLTDRVLMLVDLESRVSLMKRDLRALLSAVPNAGSRSGTARYGRFQPRRTARLRKLFYRTTLDQQQNEQYGEAESKRVGLKSGYGRANAVIRRSGGRKSYRT